MLNLSSWIWEGANCLCEAGDWVCKNTNCEESIRDYIPDTIEDIVMIPFNYGASNIASISRLATSAFNFANSNRLLTTTVILGTAYLSDYLYGEYSKACKDALLMKIEHCIKTGNLDKLSSLLEASIFKYTSWRDRKNMLLLSKGHLHIFKHLIKSKSFSLDGFNEGFDTFKLIKMIVNIDDEELAASFFERPHIDKEYRYEALQYASKVECLNIVNYLLKFDAIKQKLQLEEYGPFHIALRHRNWDVVKRLLEIPQVKNQVDLYDNSILHKVISNNRIDIANTLLDQDHIKATAANNNNRVLHIAIEKGLTAIVNRLLDIPCVRRNAAASNNRALCLAARTGYLPLVNRLLELPKVITNAASGNNCPLQNALTSGNLHIAERLLEIPSVSNSITADNLKDAVITGNLNIVNRLLDCPGVERKASSQDNRILNIAVQRGNLPIITRLLNVGSVRAIYKYLDRQIPIPKHIQDGLFENCKAVYLSKIGLRRILPREVANQVLFYAYHDRYCSKRHCQDRHEAIYIKPHQFRPRS